MVLRRRVWKELQADPTRDQGSNHTQIVLTDPMAEELTGQLDTVENHNRINSAVTVI